MTVSHLTRFFDNPNRTFGLFSALAVLMILFSGDIPFFWDNIEVSEIANYYFDTSFTHIIPPPQSDFGAFTLYAFYLPAVWTVFGKSLLVSHLALLPMVIGILWEIKKISLRFINPAFLPLIYLLLLFDPAFGTQLLLMGYDIFMLYFLLVGVRMLWEKKYLWYSVSLLVLSAVSVRAIIYIFCLILIHYIVLFFIDKKKLSFRDMLVYLPATVFLIIWFIFHFRETGWYFINPVNISHRYANEAKMVFRQFGFILWKISDSGRIIVWMFCALCFRMFSKQILWTTDLKKFVLFFSLPLLINTAFMIFISNPIGHKYFLQTFVFLSIMAVYFLQQIVSVRKRLVLSLGLMLCLTAGNFIMYPQKYGNAWDTSLKVLPIFYAEQQMKQYVEANYIKPSQIYSAFPLTVNHRFSHMQEDFSYSELKADSISSYPYVLYSNLLNVADLSPYHDVEKYWKLLYRLEKRQVVIALYKNPRLEQISTNH